MNVARRLILFLYCLLIVYCAVWVPWHAQLHASDISRYAGFERFGYGWIWSGPANKTLYPRLYATPDIPIILLRMLAATGICAALHIVFRLRQSGVV